MIHPVVSDMLHRHANGLKAKIREQQEIRTGLHADREAIELKIKSCGEMADGYRHELEAVEHAIQVLSQGSNL